MRAQHREGAAVPRDMGGTGNVEDTVLQIHRWATPEETQHTSLGTFFLRKLGSEWPHIPKSSGKSL